MHKVLLGPRPQVKLEHFKVFLRMIDQGQWALQVALQPRLDSLHEVTSALAALHKLATCKLQAQTPVEEGNKG